LLVVNRFAIKNKFGINIDSQKRLLIDMPCYYDKLPIPNFRDNVFSDSITFCNLPCDFKLYVLGAESGLYFSNLSEKYVSDYVPKIWEHGYSKGIALSEEKGVAIYWIIFW
jgi:hypothetical protein